ncbi:MAG: hypothetical protein JXQ73_31555 [Phycisphaerae bacterium]|nr:hypothetical protein [Phycisphaerae bacterium]
MSIFERPPDPSPRIQAISDVRIEARPELKGDLHFFYVELLGLEAVEGEPGMLCFQTDRLRVHVLMTPEAQPSPMRRRLVLEVPSLDRMAGKLEEEDIDYDRYRGLRLTDQRIFVLDPADNRVELKQPWPF